MLYSEVIAFRSEIHIKHINRIERRILNVKHGGK
jgi:hypothetical protein